MALFPDATFTIFLPRGGVVPGTRVAGTLRLDVPKAIPRAERLEVVWRTMATAAYGYGTSHHVDRQDVFVAAIDVPFDLIRPASTGDFAETLLPAGSYSYPFSLSLPPWLPPSYRGHACSISHTIDVRLDVEWAADPKTTARPTVRLAPVEIVTHPLVARSPAGFHPRCVAEITLERQAFLAGEAIRGHIALRSGQDISFDAITIAIASVASIRYGRGDRRSALKSTTRIPASALKNGTSVPFSIPNDAQLVPPTFRNGHLDHDVFVIVTLDVPSGHEASFEFPIQVLPAGSRVEVEAAGAAVLGNERLTELARWMAAATGLASGRLPTLVEARVGPVAVAIVDAPRDGRLGVDISFEFPDVELITEFRPLGTLERIRASALVPPALASHYFLRAAKGRVAEDALARFYAAILADFDATTELRLSDRRLAVHRWLDDDGSAAMTAVAEWTKARAEVIAHAISRLPFERTDAAPAWIAAAAEQKAFLVPHLPALTGISIGSIGVELRTQRDGTISAELDLRAAPLAKQPDFDGIRTVFPRVEVHSATQVTLSGAAFAEDPRALLSAVETFFARRDAGPYR